jgi:RNA-binding protein YhbY
MKMDTKRKAWQTEAEVLADIVLNGKNSGKMNKEIVEQVRGYLERRMYIKLNFKQ